MTQHGFDTRRHAFLGAAWTSLAFLALRCGSSRTDDGKGSTHEQAGSVGAGVSAGGASNQAGTAPVGAGGTGLDATGGAPDTGGSANLAGNGNLGGSAGKSEQGVAAGSAGGPITGGGSSAGGAPACSALSGGPIMTTTQHLDIGVHDPSMIWDGSRYLLFATGGTLRVRTSPDMRTWTNAGNIFSQVPAWITTTLGAAPPDLWAPDVSFFNCTFHIYYAGSTFGSRNSVIGLVTTPTLDPASPNYRFTDVGLIVRSVESDAANAIDPNVTFDDTGAPWLTWGSFGNRGIQLHQLDAATGKLSTENPTTYSIADRNGSSIEAPSIVSHNGFYYLFVSFGMCCAKTASTYTTVVGRASKITGPYTNKSGALMTDGASELLLEKSGRYIGPGGGTAFRSGSNYLYVYHYYDGDDAGASKLSVRPITWDASDWPVLGNPLFP